MGLQAVVVEPGLLQMSTYVSGLFRANLTLRTASRIMVHLGEFHARTFYQFEQRLAKLLWDDFLPPGGPSLDIRVTSRASALYHQRAIADRVRRVLGRPDPASSSGLEPSPRILIRLSHDRCSVRIDASGAPLHQRGYRLEGGVAPVRETLAAALLYASGWDQATPILDPLCGSGTFLIEAAQIAGGIAPGLGRTFACEGWRITQPEVVAAVRGETEGARRSGSLVPLVGGDRDHSAVDNARRNASRAGVADDLEFRVQPLSAWTTKDGGGSGARLVTNPPYGIRLGHRGVLRGLYQTLGRVAHAWGLPETIALLAPLTAADASRSLSLAVRSHFLTSNGGIRVRGLVGTGAGHPELATKSPQRAGASS